MPRQFISLRQLRLSLDLSQQAMAGLLQYPYSSYVRAELYKERGSMLMEALAARGFELVKLPIETAVDYMLKHDLAREGEKGNITLTSPVSAVRDVD